MSDSDEPEAADVEEVLEVDPEDVPAVLALAAEHGVRTEELELRTGEPVSTVILLLLGSALAVSTVIYLVDKRKGGQVIDLRSGAPKMFYRSKDLIYGLVLIVAAGGQVTVEVKEPRGMFGDVVDALKDVATDLGKAEIDAVTKAAKNAVGDRAEVSSHEDTPQLGP
ncbi:MAG TPA: hypothetical protein VMS64_01150 [Candidatus Methylomirabilis sp.]|nr:hypothetical protein [Candidatus Methylomirabilis sp.]